MRFVRSEKIILSQNESDTWIEFDNILSGLARGTENPETEKMVIEIQNSLQDLWNAIDLEVD